MWFDRSLLESKGIVVTLNKLRLKPDSLVTLRLVYIRKDNTWSYFIGTCHINTLPDVSEGIDIFGHYAFLTKQLPWSEFKKALQKKSHEITIDLELPPLNLDSDRWSTRLIPSSVSTTETPIWESRATLDESAPHFEPTPVIRYGWGYARPDVYIRHFLPLEDFHGASDARKGEFLIRHTENRGRISIADSVLSIKDTKRKVCIVGEIDGEADVMLLNGDTQALPPESTAMELYLIDQKERVIDYFSTQSSWFLDNDMLSESQLLTLIRTGEHLHLEFKKWVDVSGKANDKVNETYETVCAFSNADGGLLIIGVDDNGVVQGIEKQARMCYKNSTDNVLATYRADLRSRLQKNLRYADCARIEVRDLLSLQVVVVSVSTTSETNYLMNTHDAFIRKSATNSRMSPEEVQNHTSDSIHGIDYPRLR